MLAPVVEIYVVWHPGDRSGPKIAERVSAHFRGGVGTGLISNPMETYIRSAGFCGPGDTPGRYRSREGRAPEDPSRDTSPRSSRCSTTSGSSPRRTRRARGAHTPGPLRTRGQTAQVRWACSLCPRSSRGQTHDARKPLPSAADRRATHAGGSCARTVVAGALPRARAGHRTARRCGSGRLTQVFVSHTRQTRTPDDPVGPGALADLVMSVIGRTRVQGFLDAVSLQPGEDFAQRLYENAGRGAFLAVVTDLYSTRHWCLEELWTAKREGFPSSCSTPSPTARREPRRSPGTRAGCACACSKMGGRRRTSSVE